MIETSSIDRIQQKNQRKWRALRCNNKIMKTLIDIGKSDNSYKPICLANCFHILQISTDMNANHLVNEYRMSVSKKTFFVYFPM